MTVISVVLGEPNERARDTDSLALLRYGLSAYEAVTPLPQGRTLGKVDLRYRSGQAVDVIAGSMAASRSSAAVDSPIGSALTRRRSSRE